MLSAILWGRQNPRADGHGRPLADLAQGRKQDHFQQINLSNRRAQTENANPPIEIAADRKTPLSNREGPKHHCADVLANILAWRCYRYQHGRFLRRAPWWQ